MPRLETRLEQIEAALVPAVVDITIRLTIYPCETEDAIHRRAERALGRKRKPHERLILLTTTPIGARTPALGGNISIPTMPESGRRRAVFHQGRGRTRHDVPRTTPRHARRQPRD
jgi:hypothetical protein